MNVTEVITPEIAPLLPARQTVRARSRVLRSELRRDVSARVRLWRMRTLAAVVAAAATIAAVTAVELSDGSLVQRAEAFPVFSTRPLSAHVIADSILGSFLKSQGEVPGTPPNPSAPNGPYWKAAAGHAFAFPTYWGTAFTFERHDARTGYTVCTVYPDYQTKVIPDHGGWIGGCQTARTLAEAVDNWATIPDPTGVEFVELVSAGTTAVITSQHVRQQVVPVRNGVLSVRVTQRATLTVRTGASTNRYDLRPGLEDQTSIATTPAG